MDPRFLPAFENRIRTLTANDPFTWIRDMINDAVNDALAPSGMSLRADGVLFLLVNVAAMIVRPWEETESNNFLNVHGSSLAADLQDIMGEAQAIASVRNIREISANLLLSVTATRRGGMRTLALNMWGPP